MVVVHSRCDFDSMHHLVVAHHKNFRQYFSHIIPNKKRNRYNPSIFRIITNDETISFTLVQTHVSGQNWANKN